MKDQVAAEVAAAAALARSGWRPARGELLIVTVVDEETGGALGAQWITENHPDKVRCDLLVNEGGGAVFELRRADAATASAAPRRACSASRVSTSGVAGHASMPSMGDNALLKMAPLLERFAARQPSYTADRGAARASCAAIGEDPTIRAGRSSGCRRRTRGWRSASSRCSA